MENNSSTITKAAANRHLLPETLIEHRIFTIRGVQVIIDKDIAELYGVSTKRLNEQVRRNINRFPGSFRFQLTADETSEVVANCDRLSTLRFSPTKPFAFTEQGVAMLSSVLRSEEAIEISIKIMNAFVAMRHFMISNAQVFQRLDRIEFKQLETDHKIEQIFDKLEEHSVVPRQHIFFDGQIFDAYQFVSGLIKSAKNEIVLIDNYVDESVLTINIFQHSCNWTSTGTMLNMSLLKSMNSTKHTTDL